VGFAKIIVLMMHSKCFKAYVLRIFIFTLVLSNMTGSLLQSGIKKDAIDLFADISAHGLVSDVVTCCRKFHKRRVARRV
jgi:hypothetical protein